MRTAKDLVPGDPERIWLLADSYNRMARLCDDVGRGFRRLDDGGWDGPAADAFHARLERQPRRFLDTADSYGQVAVALDTYASALAWAQRQARELIAAQGKGNPPRTVATPLTTGQQAELTGVITGVDGPEPVRDDRRALADSNYRRAVAMLDSVGNESAASIAAATELLPRKASPPPAPPISRVVVRQAARPTWFDPASLRDDPRDWSAAIRALRKRLRWDGLDRLSPRLGQHIFDGHYRPSKERYTGYHHREGGLDRGVLRVVDVLAGPDRHGVYKARVVGPHSASDTTKVSNFFPDTWTRAEVLLAVRAAFLDAMRTSNYDPAKRRFRGTYNGVTIEGLLKSSPHAPRICDIVTAYPRSVRKPRT